MTYQRIKGLNWDKYSFLPSVLEMTPNALIRNHVRQYINSLPEGFSDIADYIYYEINETAVQKFSGIVNTIEVLGNVFDYKLSLPIDTISVSNENLHSVLSYLDELKEPQKNEKMENACEYRSSAINKLSVSLFDKALDLFLKSLELDDTDFFVNLQVGKIYMYCNNNQQKLTDLVKAEVYLKNALRYGQAELTSPRLIGKTEAVYVQKLVAEIALHYGVLYLIFANEGYFKENEVLTETVASDYRKALEFASLSDKIYSTLEAKYLQAKVHILTGREKESVDILRIIMNEDLKFIYRILQDKDFEKVLNVIDGLIETTDSKKPENNFIKAFELITKGKNDSARQLIKDLILTEAEYFDRFAAKCFEPLRKDIDGFRFLNMVNSLYPFPLADLEFK